MSLFSKFSTAGNTTLFVETGAPLSKIWQLIPAEQAGYVNIEKNLLEMAGGELCVNATLAFAALLQLRREKVAEVEIASQKINVEVKGKKPEWLVWAEFEPKVTMLESEAACVVHLAGITHILLQNNNLPDDATALQLAADVKMNHNLQDKPAVGVVWWKKTGSILAIKPVVSVPKANTCNLEQACGSGSLALALHLGDGSYKIQQPSGEIIKINVAGNKAAIECPVRLLAFGEAQAF